MQETPHPPSDSHDHDEIGSNSSSSCRGVPTAIQPAAFNIDGDNSITAPQLSQAQNQEEEGALLNNEDATARVSENASSSDGRSWKCHACTFINDNPLHLVCVACGTAREAKQPVLADDIEKQCGNVELIEDDEAPFSDVHIDVGAADEMKVDEDTQIAKEKPELALVEDADNVIDELPVVDDGQDNKNKTESDVINQGQQPTPVTSSAQGDVGQASPNSVSTRRQAAPTIRPSPPTATHDRPSDPSIAYYPGLNARVVEDEPSLPYVEAVPLQTSNEQTPNWWREHQRLVVGILLLIIGVMAVALGISLSSQNNGGEESTEKDAMSPPLGEQPTLSPTKHSPGTNEGAVSPTVSNPATNQTAQYLNTTAPTLSTVIGTDQPAKSDTVQPQIHPTIAPTKTTSVEPPKDPTDPPMNKPTSEPKKLSTDSPTKKQTASPSKQPTTQPTSKPPTVPTSLKRVIEKLTPLSGEEVFSDLLSPQYKAMRWIAEQDPIPNPSTGRTGLDIDDPRFEQRYIMALFYYAMDGDNWKQSQGWLSSKSGCEWFGVDGASVGCGGDDVGGCIKRSDSVQDYDKVCRMGMGKRNNLYGQIPSELGYLVEMRWFEIQDDYLYGTIPESLGTGWKNLHTFLVGGNYLHGEFPQSFANNEMLGTIFIDRNRFNDTFSSVFATLKSLVWLDAEDNMFVGTMPAGMAMLQSLRILNVNNNSMSGILPDMWEDSALIEDFEVAHNKFNGPLPATLGNSRFLKDIVVSHNELTGAIPTTYYNLENLEELYLDQNNFVGELPQTAEPFYDGLQELSIHSNNFEGRFPVEHFEGTLRIKILSLHSNQLTGTISENICDRRDPTLNWSRLEKLTTDCDLISCNCCTCYEDGELVSTFMPPTPSTVTLPSQPPTATSPNPIQVYASRPTRSPDFSLADRDTSLIQEHIETTVLQRNASFDNMDETDPRYLALDWILNKDQRQLTADDSNLSQRYVLALIAFSLDSLAWYVCGDHRNGTEEYALEDCEIFNEQTQQTERYKVWLSGADVCTWYGVSCSSNWAVDSLEMIGNDLIGQIPPEISQLPFIKSIAFNGNCLYGTLPPEIGSLSNLLALELHGNGLSGSLPEEMYDLAQLQLLNVAMQYQYSYACTRSDGRIIKTLFRMGGLTDPLEYNYGLTGQVLEKGVEKWSSMKGLHIFDNSFDGTIADLISGLEDLTFLRAQNNLLEDVIPNGIVELKNLRELYLNKNSMWGNLPLDIGMMEGLEDLRVNENELNGQLPDSLYNLFNIQKLWLQDTLKCELVDFDWECNADSDFGFEGSIHTDIGSLSHLTHLLINNNPIGGTLPTELGLCHDLSILHIHKTNIVGIVPEEVCLLRDKNLYSPSGKQGVFYADCRPNNTTEEPFLRCDCCSDCCDHTTKVCIADD